MCCDDNLWQRKENEVKGIKMKQRAIKREKKKNKIKRWKR